MAGSNTGPTSKERKNLLKQQYRNRRPDMGVFVIRTLDQKHFAIEKADDMKGTLNGSKFKLQMGNHPNRTLQEKWNRLGEESFVFEVLETLTPGEDNTIADPAGELEMLQSIWREKFLKKGCEELY